MTDDQMREEFELKFKPPKDIEWTGRYYSPRWADDKGVVFTATVHNEMIESYQAKLAARYFTKEKP